MSHISTVTIAVSSWQEIDAGLIAVGVYKDQSLTPLAQEIDKAIGGLIFRSIFICYTESFIPIFRK